MSVESCTCADCRRGCQRNPGWFTPEEARAAIAAGHASRLMRDWLEPSSRLGNDERIYVLAPASLGSEGEDAPEMDVFDLFSDWYKGRCTFYTNEGRCEIHDSGFKPFQCRLALMCSNEPWGQDSPDSNYSVAKLWNTELGRQVVQEWEEAVKLLAA